MKTVFVTTSWDDGHKLDLKLAELLKKHGVKATFYISPHDREFNSAELLSTREIRALSLDFEIGAHTLTHPHLSALDHNAMKQEIEGSKSYLEKVIGRTVHSFCYPYGDYNEMAKSVVQRTGFDFARTVSGFTSAVKDPFAAGTSVHVFDHRRDGLTSVIQLAGWQFWRVPRLMRWDNLSKQLFNQARDRGGVFHLWGHSHELEALGLWERLDAFLGWLTSQPNVRFITNADIPISAPKVLVTAPYFKPHSGGLEEYAFQISKGLQYKHGWNVQVVTSGEPDEPDTDSYQGLPVRHFRYKMRLSNTPFGISWHRKLKRLINEERPDIVVSHAPVPGMVDATATAVGRLPLIVTYHMGSMKKGSGPLDLAITAYEKAVLPFTLRKAKKLVCVSTFVQRNFLGHYLSKATVITPGVDTSLFRPSGRQIKRHSLMQIGGLKTGESHKGLEMSLQVVAALKNSFPDIQLSIVGNGDRQSYFEALAKDLGIAKQVNFRGRLAGKELVAAYQAARVVLVPSRKEGFGMAIVEAMACGVPVVASSVEGIPFLVRGGETGILVPANDVQAFADAVRKIFDDVGLASRMSIAARKCAVHSYQWVSRIDETHKLLMATIGLTMEDNKSQTIDSYLNKNDRDA